MKRHVTVAVHEQAERVMAEQQLAKRKSSCGLLTYCYCKQFERSFPRNSGFLSCRKSARGL